MTSRTQALRESQASDAPQEEVPPPASHDLEYHPYGVVDMRNNEEDHLFWMLELAKEMLAGMRESEDSRYSTLHGLVSRVTKAQDAYLANEFDGQGTGKGRPALQKYMATLVELENFMMYNQSLPKGRGEGTSAWGLDEGRRGEGSQPTTESDVDFVGLLEVGNSQVSLALAD